ncbi:MAG: hypothetical protein IJ521_08130 [Schwartzia sp.]|nr:hypothetical protein [Schwartzia sp. (in: firmicutes)]
MKKTFSRSWLVPVCIACSLALAGGCSYSAGSTTETSVGIGEGGKPRASASASMNVERSTDGKTASQTASAKLDSQKGAGFSRRKSESRSENGMKYIVEDIRLRKGETEIYGYFSNEGTASVQMKSVVLSFHVTDGNKNIWSDEGVFDDMDISVRPGEQRPYTFIVKNPEAPAYDGPLDVAYHIRF